MATNMAMDTKFCPGCNRDLPLTSFHRRTVSKDGLALRCRECCAAYKREYYKAGGAHKIRQYQKDNADNIRERDRKYWQANRDRKRENLHRFYDEHPDYNRHKMQERYRANPRKYIEMNKQWHAEHPEVEQKRARRRNFLRRGVPMDDTAKAYTEILRHDPCVYCGSYGGVEIDHILAITCGGDSSWDNLAAACRNCNNRKNNKSVLSMFVDGLR